MLQSFISKYQFSNRWFYLLIKLLCPHAYYFKKSKKLFFCQIFFAAVLIISMSHNVSAKNLVYENNWAYLADTVMGGVSQGNAEFSAGALRLPAVSTKTMVVLFK